MYMKIFTDTNCYKIKKEAYELPLYFIIQQSYAG